jgi:hypothetical protein
LPLLVLCLLMMGAAACTLQDVPVTVVVLLPTVTPTPDTPVATETPTAAPTPSYPWTDEIPTMYGICFEAAYDARDTVFVLRSAEEHIALYDAADNSGLCRRPVTRNPFEFADGNRVLAGLWSYGVGCTARHEVLGYTEQDGVLAVELRFVTDGTCNYELVRPFWIGVDGVQDVTLSVRRD